jgi:hypothetical protein
LARASPFGFKHFSVIVGGLLLALLFRVQIEASRLHPSRHPFHRIAAGKVVCRAGPSAEEVFSLAAFCLEHPFLGGSNSALLDRPALYRISGERNVDDCYWMRLAAFCSGEPACGARKEASITLA